MCVLGGGYGRYSTCTCRMQRAHPPPRAAVLGRAVPCKTYSASGVGHSRAHVMYAASMLPASPAPAPAAAAAAAVGRVKAVLPCPVSCNSVAAVSQSVLRVGAAVRARGLACPGSP